MLTLRGKGRFGGRFERGTRPRGAGKRGTSKYPDGLYDSWWPKEISTWINISPYQGYTYEVYDKPSGSVIEVTTRWYEYTEHRNFQKKFGMNRFTCSTGAHRLYPCLGHAVRKIHFDEMDSIEKEKGYKPDKKSPVSAYIQFALGITIMETIYDVPKMKEGKVHKTRRGDIIYKHFPEPAAGDLRQDDGTIPYQSHFGMKCHWSLGGTHLDLLLSEDLKLRGRCAECAGDLFALSRTCPDCEAVVTYDTPLTGEDLLQARGVRSKCGACGFQDQAKEKDDRHYHTEWVFQYSCADCGGDQEGGLTKFDLRLKRVKAGTTSTLEITDIRVPTNDEEVQKLIQNPLKLDAIFAPGDIKLQQKVLGSLAEGVDPLFGAFTEDYSSGGGTTADDGEDAPPIDNDTIPY